MQGKGQGRFAGQNQTRYFGLQTGQVVGQWVRALPVNKTKVKGVDGKQVKGQFPGLLCLSLSLVGFLGFRFGVLFFACRTPGEIQGLAVNGKTGKSRFLAS